MATMVVVLLWSLPPLQDQEHRGCALLAPPDHFQRRRWVPGFSSLASSIIFTSFQAREQMVGASDVAGSRHNGDAIRHHLRPNLRSLQIPVSASEYSSLDQVLGTKTPERRIDSNIKCQLVKAQIIFQCIHQVCHDYHPLSPQQRDAHHGRS